MKVEALAGDTLRIPWRAMAALLAGNPDFSSEVLEAWLRDMPIPDVFVLAPDMKMA